MKTAGEKDLQLRCRWRGPIKERIVQANLIEKAVLSGKRVELRYAIIRGPLRLKGRTVEKDLCFLGCHFEDRVEFSHSLFKANLIFSSSTFSRGCDLRSTKVAGDCRLKNAKFDSMANFTDLEIVGLLLANRACFKRHVGFERAHFAKSASFYATRFQKGATFDEAQFSGDAVFRIVKFLGEASFVALHVFGQANFIGATFKQNTTFDSGRFEGNVFFRSEFEKKQAATVFEGDVNFTACHINGAVAEFEGAFFRRKAIFDYVKIAGDAFFSISGPQSTIFNGPASFVHAHIDGFADFRGALFRQKASFNSIRVEGSAYFRAVLGDKLFVTTFNKDADFTLARINGTAEFDGSLFKQRAIFNGLHVLGNLYFRPAAGISPSVTTFAGDADFTRAYIEGSAEFDSVVFKHNAVFNGTRIDDGAFFRSSSNQKLVFLGDVTFYSAHFGRVADFRGAIFVRKADFRAVTVRGNVIFEGAEFGSTLFLTTDQTSPTTFQASADWTGANIEGSASFSGSRFGGKANFNSIHVGGHTLFQSRAGKNPLVTTFHGDVEFTAALLDGYAVFSGVVFEGKLEFSGARIGGHVFFRPEFQKTVFKQDVNFFGTEIKGSVDFQRSIFERKAVFEQIRIGGRALLNGMHFKNSVVVEPDQTSSITPIIGASFIGARFGGPADFTYAAFEKGGSCDRGAAFDYASFEQDAHLEKAVFRCKASFRETRFRVVNFSKNGRVDNENQFQDILDLSGCTYDRIQVNWKSFLTSERKLFWKIKRRETRIEYDLQPYIQLEHALRNAGEDQAAAKVYLERRRVHRKQKWKRSGFWKIGWVWDMVHFLLARYGVRPWQLPLISLAAIVVGFLVFLQPNALELKPELQKINTTETRTCVDVFGVTLRYFLPGVEVPLGSKWLPSDQRIAVCGTQIKTIPSVWAFILRIIGWIVVPVGILVLTGFVRRVSG